MHQIRAAVLRRGGALAIETLKLEGPRPDEVLVLLSATGICHTDLNFMEDWNGPPVVLGHEGAGVVLEVGKDLKSVRPGDHVVLSYQSCGRCGPCRQGHPTACRHFWEANFGFRRLDGSNALEGSGVSGHFFGQSSFASHCLATERNLVKVPPDLPLELLAPLGCGLQTGAGTVLNSLKVPKEASIAIFGTGAVGLAAVMAARLTGADPIIGVDLNPARLELALTLGASRVIDNRREEVISQIQQITGGGVDYVLETTGDQEMHQLGLEVLNPRGTLALIAHPGGGGPVPGGRRALGIIQGDAVPQSFIPRLIALYRAGQFPYDRLLRYYDFEEIHRALAEARRGDAIKPVLRFGAAA